MTERAARAQQTVEEQAEEARRQVLGARSRLRPARVAPAVTDEGGLSAGELSDILRRLAGDIEEETSRLRDEAGNVRSEAARAAATLHAELEQRAEAMAEQAAAQAAEEIEREVGPTVAEGVADLTEQLVRLEMVTSTLLGAVERLAGLAPAVERLQAIVPAVERLETIVPVVDRLERIAEQGASEAVTGPLADALGELSSHLSAVSGAIREQVAGAVEQALISDARRRDASMTQALARLTDEFVRLRQHVASRSAPPTKETPAAKKPAAKKPAAKKSTAKKKQPAKKRAPAKKAPADTPDGG